MASSMKENLAICSSVFRKNLKHVPKDINENEPKIPQVFNLLNYCKDTEIDLNKFATAEIANINIAHGLICPFVKFTFPKINATSFGDFVRYCNLPAIYIFNNISLLINSVIVETISNIKLEYILQNFLQENFVEYANKWLGGIDGENQKFSGCQHFYGNFSSTAEVLKDEISCLLPLPFSFFRNDLYLPLNLIKNSKISIQFGLNNPSSILSYNKSFDMTSLFSQLTLSHYYTLFSFNDCIFNNLPEVNPSSLDTPYLLENLLIDSTDIAVNKNSDLIFYLKNIPTTQYLVNISNKEFYSNFTFWGRDNEECRANWLASLIGIKKFNTDTHSSLSLKKLQFLNNSTSYGNYNVEKINEKSFKIIKIFNDGNIVETIVTCTIPFNLFPDDFVLSFNGLNNENKKENSKMTLDMFHSFNLVVEEYDQYCNRYIENSGLQDGVLKILHNGYFTFINNENNCKYAFVKIDNITRNKHTKKSDYEILPSQPIKIKENETNISQFILKKFTIQNLPMWIWYDLDKKFPIEVESYSISKSDNIVFYKNAVDIELERQRTQYKMSKYMNDKFQIDRMIQLIKNDKCSLGFLTFKEPYKVSINLKYHDCTEEEKKLIVNANANYNICLLQIHLKMLKFNPNAANGENIKTLSLNEIKMLANDVIENETDENGVFQDFYVQLDDEPQHEEEIDPNQFSNKIHNSFLNKKQKNNNLYDVEVYDDEDFGINQSSNKLIKRIKN